MPGSRDRCRDLNAQIKTLDAELRVLVTRLGPSLLAVPGCGVLSAAVIIGETAGVHRFRNKDAFARFTDTAPVPVWSGAGEGKVRLNRGGNRAMNCALYMIAVTQARGVGPGRATSPSKPSEARTPPPRSACSAAAYPTSSSPRYAPTNDPDPTTPLQTASPTQLEHRSIA